MKSCYQDNTGGSVLRKEILNLQNNKVTQASFLKMSSFCFLGFNYNSEASLEDLGLFSLWTETVKPVKKTNKKKEKNREWNFDYTNSCQNLWNMSNSFYNNEF